MPAPREANEPLSEKCDVELDGAMINMPVMQVVVVVILVNSRREMQMSPLVIWGSGEVGVGGMPVEMKKEKERKTKKGRK